MVISVNMKTKSLLKLTILELLRYKNITLFLVLNLTLGLLGFFLLQVFQQSLNQQAAEKAQTILGADISISARYSFTEEERKKWEEEISFVKRAHLITLFSMLRTADDSKLVNIAAFDDHYPLYGQYKLSSGATFSFTKPYVWVDPEIQLLLNLKVNDTVDIGEFKFIYAGTIIEDPSRLLSISSFAPKVIIHQKYLATAGLIKPGSTFTDYWYYKIDPNLNLTAIKSKLEAKINDPVITINTSQDSSQSSSTVIRYFTDYLGLVALVALGLCFLCGSYLLQWTFLSKKKTIAIYKTLGLSDKKIIVMYLIQNLIISLLACILGIALAQAIIPFLQQLITETFNLPIVLVFNFQAMVIVCFIAVFGPLLIVVPQIIQIINLRPLILLQNLHTQEFRRSPVYFVWLATTIGLLWVLAVWQSKSFNIASLFTGYLVGLVILFQFINFSILFLLERFVQRRTANQLQIIKINLNELWLIKYAIKGLTRKRTSTGLVFTTMSLATLVLSLLPHVKSSIISEVKPEHVSQIPSLFLFDIQPDQVAGLQSTAKELLNQDLVLSPLVRARILKINDKNYEKALPTGEMQTRESEQEARFRNRSINLTYRSWLQDSEKNVKGRFVGVAPPPPALPHISIEQKYAERMGVRINDVITFDVQGVEIRTQVSSLRQVRWTSFQPNFFILFPVGVLEGMPQIFLTSVSSLPNSMPNSISNLENNSAIVEFQKRVANQFKNVSIVDVARTIESSLKYVDQMALGLQLMAWLAVLVGVLVFLVLINTQIKERLQEMNLLQVLGSTSQQILKILLIQFLLLILISITCGVLLGLGMSWVIVTYFFDITTVYDGYYLLLLGSIFIPLCGVALYIGLKPLKKLQPMDLIRQG